LDSKYLNVEKLTGLQLADAMTDYVNTFSRDKSKEFIEAFCRQHNTLQQSSFRMILELIEHMASDNYRVDGRNEATKKIAQKLIDGFKKVIYEEELAMGYSQDQARETAESEFVKPSGFLPYI
jgi:hypothetical protein